MSMTQSSIFRRLQEPLPVPPPEKITLQPRPAVISVIAFSPHGYIEQTITEAQAVKPFLEEWAVTWLNIDGAPQPELVKEIGELFKLHPLALDDVIHLQERAKVDEYEDHLYIVARMVDVAGEVDTEQVSIFVSDRFVITFQEKEGGDCLNPTRDRIRRGLDNIRSYGTAYLVYSILDAIIHAYFPVLETYGEYLEDMEDIIAVQPTKAVITRIHDVKRNLLELRRAIWPMREVLHALMHNNTLFASQEVNFHLRSSYDDAVQVIDLIEVDREQCADLMDFYLSSVGNRTNEVMKLLTIISTIFMPLTFVAGVYGMNFNTDVSPFNMPELNWYYGYPFAMLLMAAMAGLLLWYYRRKGWI